MAIRGSSSELGVYRSMFHVWLLKIYGYFRVRGECLFIVWRISRQTEKSNGQLCCRKCTRSYTCLKFLAYAKLISAYNRTSVRLFFKPWKFIFILCFTCPTRQGKNSEVRLLQVYQLIRLRECIYPLHTRFFIFLPVTFWQRKNVTCQACEWQILSS